MDTGPMTRLRHLRSRLSGTARDERAGEVEPDGWAARARDALGALERNFAAPGTALFREKAPSRPTDRRYAYLWPFGQALAATLGVAALPGAPPRHLDRARELAAGGFARYWDASTEPPGATAYPGERGGHKFYDDNLWMGLELVALARATGERRWIADAERVFAFVAAAWDDDEAHPAPGGVFWAEAAANPTRDRNTVSNAPTAQLALHLRELTGEARYLDWARRAFGWVEATLQDPDDTLYWDHLKLDGSFERTKWSYNQGTMLGAAALFNRVAGDPDALTRARLIADRALAHYATDDRLWSQDPAFNAIFFRNLRLLGDLIGGHGFYLPALVEYAERAWATRDPRTGLIGCGRRGRVELLTQAAAVQLCATLAAVQDGPGTGSPIIPPTGKAAGGGEGR